jgi:ribosome-associated heat shock protein Hsp15
MEEGVRIDKWLWAVRIYKTRSMATQACKSGKVRIGEAAVKPSREIHAGDIITVSIPPVTRTLRVIVPIVNRVAARLVVDFALDMTPPGEYEKLKQLHEGRFGFRPRGVGRPTKRERRDIEILKKYLGA